MGGTLSVARGLLRPQSLDALSFVEGTAANSEEILEECPPLQPVPAAAEENPAEFEDLPALELAPEECQGICGICFDQVDELISLSCSHTFCTSCLTGQLNARWPGSRVSFNYLACALCRAPLEHDSLDLQRHLILQRRVVAVAEQQFRENGSAKNLAAEFGRQPHEDEVRTRAIQDMAVHLCCDCGAPYCAGRVDCAAVANLEETDSCLPMRCPGCEWTAAQGVNDLRCMIHGHRFAMFKCDSCCAEATYNCYSNHYCERCHDDAHIAKNYPCPGPEKCPLGIPHPPNMEAVHGSDAVASFVIGCIACIGCIDEADDDVSFGEQNVFGFPERAWHDFKTGAQVLASIGEDEVRARIKDLEPKLVSEQGGLSAELCADWLLSLERAAVKDRMVREEGQLKAEEERIKRLNQQNADYYAYEQEMKKTLDIECVHDHLDPLAYEHTASKAVQEQSRAVAAAHAVAAKRRLAVRSERLIVQWRKSCGRGSTSSSRQRPHQRGGRHKVSVLHFSGLDIDDISLSPFSDGAFGAHDSM